MGKSLILETLEKAQAVKPFAEIDGMKLVSFEDQAILANKEGIDPTPDIGAWTLNRDGSVARTKKATTAINPEKYFDNRYRLKGKLGRELWIVTAFDPTGYRCIKEQSVGQVYLKNIPCHVVVRDEETKELRVDRVEIVSDTEFVSEFTHKLSIENMAKIQKLISEHGSDLSATESMPI